VRFSTAPSQTYPRASCWCLDKKFPSFGHTVHVIFGDPIHPGEFESVPELLDEVQLRITTLEVPR
jgi:1-acyl-sn-glycerol-3-phosphate acyltransferase